MNTSAIPDKVQFFKYDFERVLVWKIKIRVLSFFFGQHIMNINSVVKSTPNISKNDQVC